MKETCPSCYSCGMPLKQVSDFALGDPTQNYCSHCTDAHGRLKSYEEILDGVANYLAHSQGVAMAAAIGIAKGLLAEQPAWKDRSRGGV